MKILIFGNHTCSNRGDAAIARGTVDLIRKKYPTAQLDIMSRFPLSGEILCQWPVLQDPFHTYYQGGKGSISKFFRKFMMKKYPYLYEKKLKKHTLFKYMPDSPPMKAFKEVIKDYDFFIQVGGSFFVDLYGPSQYDAALSLISAKKEFHFIGHSLGPFGNENYQRLSEFVLSNATSIYVREPESLKLVSQLNINDKNVDTCIDCAFFVDIEQNKEKVSFNLNKITKPMVAITMRSLAPFDQRLGITQAEYEKSFSEIAKWLISEGYAVIGLSTCTAICGYHKDDREIIHNVHSNLDFDKNFYCILDELNDLELGHVLSSCELTIGTRLHSTIISMTFGTPAIAIYYEHKSQGVFEDIGIAELSFQIQDMKSNHFKEIIRKTLSDNCYRKEIKDKISSYITSGKDYLLSKLQIKV